MTGDGLDVSGKVLRGFLLYDVSLIHRSQISVITSLSVLVCKNLVLSFGLLYFRDSVAAVEEKKRTIFRERDVIRELRKHACVFFYRGTKVVDIVTVAVLAFDEL